MKGVQFVVNERGEKKAVLINLEKNKQLWEDFYDMAIAKERELETRESLEDVRNKVLGK